MVKFYHVIFLIMFLLLAICANTAVSAQILDEKTYKEYQKKIKSLEDTLYKENLTLKNFKDRNDQKNVDWISKRILKFENELQIYKDKINDHENILQKKKEIDVANKKIENLKLDIKDKVTKLKDIYSIEIDDIDYNKSYEDLLSDSDRIKKLLEKHQYSDKLNSIKKQIDSIEAELKPRGYLAENNQNILSLDDHIEYLKKLKELQNLNKQLEKIDSKISFLEDAGQIVEKNYDKESLDSLEKFNKLLDQKIANYEYFVKKSEENRINAEMKSQDRLERLAVLKNLANAKKDKYSDWIETEGFRDIKFGMTLDDVKELGYKLKRIDKYDDMLESLAGIEILAGIISTENEKHCYKDMPFFQIRNKARNNNYSYIIEELSEPTILIYFSEKKVIDAIELQFYYISIEKADQIFSTINKKYIKNYSYNINGDFAEYSKPNSEKFKYETSIFNYGSIVYDAVSFKIDPNYSNILKLRTINKEILKSKYSVFTNIFYISPEYSLKNLEEYRHVVERSEELAAKKVQDMKEHKDISGDL